MNNSNKIIKKISITLVSLTLSISAYAEQDLNKKLRGTYAVNTTGACITSAAPFPGTGTWTEQLSSAGEITYYGDGTATEEGRVGVTDSNGFADIGNYTCEWEYQVNPDRTFEYDGQCEVITIFNPTATPSIVTDLKWYGHLGKGNKKTLLIERHDGLVEGAYDPINDPTGVEKICGKTGTQLKIKGLQ